MPYLKRLRTENPQVYVLRGNVTTLGRSGEVDIALRGDRRVSKLHARIEREATGYVIADLGSRNGTFVNDHPVVGEPAPLLPGDHIRLGQTDLVFEEGEPEDKKPGDSAPEGSRPMECTDDLPAPASLFRADQLPYTQAGRTPDRRTGDPDSQLLRLTELSKAAMTVGSEAELGDLVTGRLLAWMNADCCAIVHPREIEGGYDLEVKTLASRPGKDGREISISKTAVGQALENRMASITTNAMGDQRFRDQQSVIIRGLASILCVPLWHEDRVFGLLYLDSSDPSVPFTEEHLGLVSAVANLAAIKTDNLRLFAAAVARSALDKELALAGEIQAGLLPADHYVFKSLMCSGRHQSCTAIGGDYFDFIPFGEDVLTVTIADVTGHGPSSAMLMVACKTMLTTLVDIKVPLPERVERLNEYMVHHAASHQFITFFHAEIDLEEHSLRYCNAGHNPPLILPPGDAPLTRLHPAGPPLGIVSCSFDLETVDFPTGSKLVMYTDGITEAVDPNGELYEEERLESLLSKCRRLDADGLKNNVMAEVQAFAAGREQADDITLAVVEHTL